MMHIMLPLPHWILSNFKVIISNFGILQLCFNFSLLWIGKYYEKSKIKIDMLYEKSEIYYSCQLCTFIKCGIHINKRFQLIYHSYIYVHTYLCNSACFKLIKVIVHILRLVVDYTQLARATR